MGAGSGFNIWRLREEDYPFVIEHLDEWLGGRHGVPMLGRFFFEHFSSTSLTAELSGEIVWFPCRVRLAV